MFLAKVLSRFQNQHRDEVKTRESLSVEALEERMMLSSVEIFAAGATGEENLDLSINGEFQQSFFAVGGDASARDFRRFTFETDQTITPADIAIGFSNDAFDPSIGLDRDLIVDRIVVDGVSVEAEDPSTFSTGIFRDGGLTGPGFLQTEVLNINGVLSFADPASTGGSGDRIQFDAFGTTGEEIVDLLVDGRTVASFQLVNPGVSTTFFFDSADSSIAIEDIRLEFANDLFDADRGIDRNVQISQFQVIDGETGDVQTARTSDANVLSSGIFVDGVGITEGFGTGGFLAGNGFVEISDGDSNVSGDRIEFDAVGSTGEELVNLLIDGEVVQTFGLFNSNVTFVFESDDPNVSIEDVRLEFVNDLFDPDRGIDRNVSISEFRVIDGETGAVQSASTSDSNVLSSGIFADGRITQGLGAGGFIVGNFQGNGFVEVGDDSRSLDQFEAAFQILQRQTGPQGQTAVVTAVVSAVSIIPPSVGSNIPIGARPIRFVAAFDGDGAPLSSFGDGGIVNLTELVGPSLDLADPVLSVLELEFFEDGSLLIVGNAIANEDAIIRGPLFVPGVTPVQFVAKLNPDGTLDESFFQQGVLSGNFLQLGNTEVIFQTSLEAEIGSDGSVNLLAAIVDDFGGPFDVQQSPADLIVARFSADDGTLDTTFGNNGTTIIRSSEFDAPRFSTQDFQVDNQGAIFFTLNTGTATRPTSSSGSIAIGRLLANGSRDTDFGENGIFNQS